MTGPEEEAEAHECVACRGTGQVVSNAGGEPHDVICPWCEGGKRQLAEHDSQEAGERLREAPPGDGG